MNRLPDNISDHNPFPTPPKKHREEKDTMYWVIHPVLLILITLAAAFFGVCIGASIAMTVVR